MAKIDFEKLAADLALIIRQHPNQVKRIQFINGLKDRMNTSTADRFFEALLKETYIVTITPRTYKFTIDKRFFDHNKLIEFFDNHDIKRSHNAMINKTPEEKAEIYARIRETKKQKRLSEEKVRTFTLQDISDEELHAELARREAIRANKKRLDDILAVADISIDDLKSLINMFE